MVVFIVCCGIFLLILDPQCGLAGAREGLELCIKTAIPSLLPFFFLSILLTNRLSGRSIPIFRPLGRLLRIPAGTESIFLTGILGGYPVGAQAVAQAFRAGALDSATARRMLGFCSNAGPSFIFGILSGMFSSSYAAWALWIIHILSAILAGCLLPGGSQGNALLSRSENISLTAALERALRIMANVCGWVIMFRVVISFLNRWVLWLCPAFLLNLIIGALELTNGCCMLGAIDNEGLRFIMASCFLAFGGSCVAMQTKAVTGSLGTGLYFPGKIMQTVISLFLALGCQALLFPSGPRLLCHPVLLFPVLIILLLTIYILKKHKNCGSIPALSGV